jgi:hypothetical protein
MSACRCLQLAMLDAIHACAHADKLANTAANS